MWGEISFGDIIFNLVRVNFIFFLPLIYFWSFLSIVQISFGKSYLTSFGWIPGSKDIWKIILSSSQKSTIQKKLQELHLSGGQISFGTF